MTSFVDFEILTAAALNAEFAGKVDASAFTAALAGKLDATGGALAVPAALIGTGTVTGQAYQFQSAISVDPGAIEANARRTMFNTTLNYSANTSNIWEGVTAFTYVNGPGQALGEINGFHAYIEFRAGSHGAATEGFEASMQNFGVVGEYASYLSIPHNATGGTASVIHGTRYGFQNDNAAAGSVGVYAAIDNEAMTGAGSRPSFYYFIRNGDATAGITTLGGIRIGDLNEATPRALTIQGADNSSGTYPVTVKNLAGNNVLLVNNAGEVGSYAWFLVNGVRVLGVRQTGWTAMSGASNAATAYDSGTITLPQLAARVGALQLALMNHGMIGT